MAVYGLQADINANQGRNVNLYTPGRTKLSPTDVFLGGTGTGVSDAELNGAVRVFGDTAQGTAMALNDYNNDLFSQTKAAIAQNAAPRVDANRGTPTLARQAQEIQQAQGKISNDMNAAQLTGIYNNAPTLARRAQAIQNAQFNANLAQDESQFERTLASGGGSSAAQVKAKNTAEAYGDVDEAILQGTPWETIRSNIVSNAAGYTQAGLSFTTVLDYVEAKYKAAQDNYVASQPTYAESKANSLTNSAFKRW